MGLLIWLPLHGNLNNYGSSPVTFSLVTTGGGVAAATSGGKTDLSCYQRTTVNTASHIASSAGVTLDKDFTMACWCYPTTAGNVSSANGVLTNHNHGDSSGAGITLKYVSSTDCRMSCNTGNGSSRTYMDYYGTTNIYGAWHHLCLTYEKATQKYRLYVDGVCEKEFTYGNSAKANKFNIFDWSTGYSTEAAYRPLCRVNDVRVYDNCLSKREVKLLSQGLVAHYKLSAGGANNLLTNTSNPVATTGLVYAPSSIVYDNDLEANVFERRTTATTESYIGSNRTIKVDPNAQYTFSCDIKVNNMVKSVDFFWLSDTTDNVKTGASYVDVTTIGGQTFTPDEWHHFTWTFTTKANVNTGYIRIDNNGTKTDGSAAVLRVTNLKLEKGKKDSGYSLSLAESGFSVADDCSGYGRNGTTSGTFKFDTDSPRYSTCAIFDGSTTRVNLPIKKLMQAILKDKCTINFWVNEADTGNRSVYFGGYSGSNFNIEMQSAQFRVYWNAAPDFFVGGVTANTWTMFTVVIDVATGIKVYKNGALMGKKDGALTDITSGFTNDTFRIGSDTRTDSTMMEGKMSDFRIYCSALSDADILDLYRNAGSVTRDGRLIAYEFQESLENNAKIQKNGIFSAEDFSELGPLGDMKIQVLSDGSAWARVFYHNNVGGTVFFTSVDEAKSCNTPNKYSCLHLLDSFKNRDGKYEFMMTFPTEYPGKYNRWKQNNNPCKEYVTTTDAGTGTAAGYSAVSVTWTGNYWGGLARQNSSETSKSGCFLSGSVGHGNWFYAIGAFEVWSSKMPGPNGAAVSDVELWVRIDNLPVNTQFSILKE